VIVYFIYSRIITPTEVGHYKTLYDGTRVEAEHYKTLYDVTRVEAERYKALSNVTHVEAESIAKGKLVLEDEVNQLGMRLRDAKASAFWEMTRMIDTNMFVPSTSLIPTRTDDVA